MDTCIKAGTYCPVCKGIPSADCWHRASEFQRGANYSEEYFSTLDQLKQLRAENEGLRMALEKCFITLSQCKQWQERLNTLTCHNHEVVESALAALKEIEK